MKRIRTGMLLLSAVLLAAGCGKGNQEESTAGSTTAAVSEQETEVQVVLDYTLAAESDFETVVQDGTVTILSYQGDQKAIEIPAEIGGNPVVAIGESSFMNADITGIKLPDTVTMIGDGSFYCCESLRQVLLPEGMTEIGVHAFAGCTALEQITLPHTLTRIGMYAFNGAGLKQVQIPEGITCVETGTFQACTGLTKVSLPENVTEFGDDAFYNCTALEEIAGFPKTFTYVGGQCVGNTPWYEAYCEEMGDGYVVWGDYLYGWNGALEAELPEVSCICGYAFAGNEALTEVTIPDSVISIGGYAFSACPGLTSVYIPNTVETLGAGVFYNSTALQEVHLPEGLTHLPEGLFAECLALQTVNLPEKLTEVPEDCFTMCYSLKDITLPETVTIIGSQAFAACLDLEEMYIPDTVTNVGSLAFGYCTYTTVNCQAAERPADWAEDWCGTEADENLCMEVNWGVAQ